MIPFPVPGTSILVKLAAAVLVSVGLFGVGFYEGHHIATNAAKAQIVTRVLMQTKYLPQETKTLTVTVEKIKTVHDKVYINVAKIVPDNRVCDVPAAGLGLLNSNRAMPAAN